MVTAEPAYLDTTTQRHHAEIGAGKREQVVDESSCVHQLLEPVSLSDNQSENSGASSSSSTTTTSQRSHNASEDEDEERQVIRCSAVHTLERDMPDFDYSHLVQELRQLIKVHALENPGLYSQQDLDKCATDDWHLSRFLLRHKLDLNAAFEMLKQAMRFNNESLAHHLRPQDFPAEFYQLGGIFTHGHDRKGNKMLYLRVRVHKKTPEIAAIVQAFIYFNIKRADDAAQGKGISLVIDCTGGGLANADMDALLFIISTLKNYFPKGLSYFLVHEIPWILKPFWHIAKAWVPEEHRQLIKFSDSRTIDEYIERDQLPDFMGGLGSPDEYQRIPDDCVTLEQAAKLWGVKRHVLKRVLDKFKEHLPEETVRRIEEYFQSEEQRINGEEDEEEDEENNHHDEDNEKEGEKMPKANVVVTHSHGQSDQRSGYEID